MNPLEMTSVAIDITEGCDELAEYDVILASGERFSDVPETTHDATDIVGCNVESRWRTIGDQT
jgi:hypothetical protein